MRLTEIRKRLQRELRNRGDFIHDIERNKMDKIEITEGAGNAKLQCVTITDVPYQQLDDHYQIWSLNLEHAMIGLTTIGKVVDGALMILRREHLNVYLIELKSSLTDNLRDTNSLDHIKAKFSESMSRVLVLLTINQHESSTYKGRYEQVKLKFFGVTFYNKDDVRTISPVDIYKVFDLDRNQQHGDRIVDVETLLAPHEKIRVKFIRNPDQKSSQITIPFQEFITF